MTRVTIIGTGDHAYGIAHLFKMNNTEQSGNVLEVTKQNLREEAPFHDTGVSLSDLDGALERADVCILAIPAHALRSFVSKHYGQLQGKILVDATNSSEPGKDLSAVLTGTDVRWVKGFNDFGAVDVLLKKASSKKFESKMCSPDLASLLTVQEFAETSLGMNIKRVPYEHYHAVAQEQNSIGDEWMAATVIMLVVFALCQAYNITRHPVAKGYPWYSFPLFITNKAICWAALTGFALAQVPGIMARMHNAIYPNTLLDKPKWLRSSLNVRKYVGLVSLWFLAVHLFMSMLMFGPNYYSRFFVDPEDPLSRMSAEGESSFMFGSLGAALYCILGICSLPSIAEIMTNKQWQFVYGPVAWSALTFGTVHVICQGATITWTSKTWPWGLPPITLTSTVFPMFVIALKVFQVFFVFVGNMLCKSKRHVERGGGAKSKKVMVCCGRYLEFGTVPGEEQFAPLEAKD